MKDKYIKVICGGLSEEREVSLRSGANVHAALQRLGFKNAELIDFKDSHALEYLIKEKQANKFDFAFLLTHGTYGEDGCIQGFCKLIGVKYSGSNVETSAICMNKIRCKEILSANNLSVLKTIRAKDLYESKAGQELESSEMIFKPIIGGSSVGIQKFNSKAEFIKFIDANAKYKAKLDQCFIEKFIKGTEVTTSIIDLKDNSLIQKNKEHCQSLTIDGRNLISLPILELRPKKEFYDYEAKYTPGMTEFILPAAINKKLEEKIHKLALEAFYRLDCRGAARVDFIIDNQTEQPYILELNTLPGMTDTSDLPAQAMAAGISYEELVLNLVSS